MNIFVQTSQHIIEVTKITHIVVNPDDREKSTVYLDNGFSTEMNTDESDAMLECLRRIPEIILVTTGRPVPPMDPEPAKASRKPTPKHSRKGA